MKKLKTRIGNYLLWQNIAGIVLSMVVVLVLLIQKKAWEPWHFIYTLVPAIGCTLIYLGARLTLSSAFGVALPTLTRKKKQLLLLLVGLLFLMEFLLYWIS